MFSLGCFDVILEKKTINVFLIESADTSPEAIVCFLNVRIMCVSVMGVFVRGRHTQRI